ncbi:MAG: PQQ-binding-like beta-propeller repeat protein [Planctomycetaceae bacterium]
MWRPCVAIVVVLALITQSCQLSAADEIAGELVGLNVSLAAEKQLVVFDQLVTAGEWAAAIDLLDRLSADPSDVLVKASAGRYVGLRIAIQQRLTRLPPAGLEAYRKRTTSNSATLLARARAEGRPALLWRLVEDSAATPAGQSATQDLATQAATRGDLELALRLWSRLLPPSPAEVQPDYPPMLSVPLADPQQIESLTRKVDLTRQLIGSPLAASERHALRENVPSGAQPALSKGGDLPENSPAPPNRPPRFGPVRWSTAATANCPEPEYHAPLSLAARSSGLLVINDGYVVRAVQAATGDPYWSTNLPDDVGVVWESSDSTQESASELPCRIAGGFCTSDRYFGVLGDAPRWRARPGLIPLSGSLIALDLSMGQGRLDWRVESRDLPESDWLFHGAPALARGHLPGDDLVVVPLCRPDSQVELAVAAFFADDGRLAWWRRIGTSAAAPGRPLPETQLLVSAGLIVARTLTGVVVAVDSRHGQIEWASTALVSSPPTLRGSHASLLDARGGLLVVGSPAPSRTDPPQVAGFSLDSGEEVWRQAIPFPVQSVVCAGTEKVLVAGSRLRAMASQNGRPLWEHGTEDPIGAGTGAPRVYNLTVVWPTRTGLWGVDLASGTIEFERRITIEPVAQPMELLPVGTYWMLARPDAVLCLPDSSSLHP